MSVVALVRPDRTLRADLKWRSYFHVSMAVSRMHLASFLLVLQRLPDSSLVA
jgi:hypothetical protein